MDDDARARGSNASPKVPRRPAVRAVIVGVVVRDLGDGRGGGDASGGRCAGGRRRTPAPRHRPCARRAQRATAADAARATLGPSARGGAKGNRWAEASLAPGGRCGSIHAPSAMALVLLPQTRGVGTVPIVGVGPEATTVGVPYAGESRIRDGAWVLRRDAQRGPSRAIRIVWRGGPFAAEDGQHTARLVSVALPAHPTQVTTLRRWICSRPEHGRGRDFAGSYTFEVVRPLSHPLFPYL